MARINALFDLFLRGVFAFPRRPAGGSQPNRLTPSASVFCLPLNRVSNRIAGSFLGCTNLPAHCNCFSAWLPHHMPCFCHHSSLHQQFTIHNFNISTFYTSPANTKTWLTRHPPTSAPRTIIFHNDLPDILFLIQKTGCQHKGHQPLIRKLVKEPPTTSLSRSQQLVGQASASTKAIQDGSSSENT